MKCLSVHISCWSPSGCSNSMFKLPLHNRRRVETSPTLNWEWRWASSKYLLLNDWIIYISHSFSNTLQSYVENKTLVFAIKLLFTAVNIYFLILTNHLYVYIFSTTALLGTTHHGDLATLLSEQNPEVDGNSVIFDIKCWVYIVNRVSMLSLYTFLHFHPEKFLCIFLIC